MLKPESWGVTALVVLALASGSSLYAAAPMAKVQPGVRLYTLDCGHYAQTDMRVLSDTGEYDGKTGSLAGPCFLIRHSKGLMLWDTGDPNPQAKLEPGANPVSTPTKPLGVTLVSQLKMLGIYPEDITYVAFSHLHGDHVGNAALFRSATWILSRKELDWAMKNPLGSSGPEFIAAYKNAKTQILDPEYNLEKDYDVFGDGRVKILNTPGHTPGSLSLEVKLERSGTVILTGDLFQTRENRKYRRVPEENFSRAESLASMDRIEAIAKITRARVIVQHDEEDFESLPKFPRFLD